MAETKKKASTTKTASKAETAAKPKAPKKTDSFTYESIVELFKNKVAKSIAPVDALVVAQIKLYGDVEGTLYVNVANGRVVVEPYDYKGADIEIDADAKTFASVLNGKKALALAIVEGSIKMQGNAGKAIVLASNVF